MPSTRCARRERRIDRRGLAQAGRSSAMSDDCWRLCGEATPLLAADTWRRAGCCSGGGCAGARRQGGTDCGRQRGRAGRRHAAPRCALRPSLPLVFSSRYVQLWRPAEALCRCCVQFMCSDSSMLARSALEGLRGQDFGWLKRRSNGRTRCSRHAPSPSLTVGFPGTCWLSRCCCNRCMCAGSLSDAWDTSRRSCSSFGWT